MGLPRWQLQVDATKSSEAPLDGVGKAALGCWLVGEHDPEYLPYLVLHRSLCAALRAREVALLSIHPGFES